MSSARHRRIPEKLRGAGALYLWPVASRALGRALAALQAAGRAPSLVEGCLRVALDEGDVQACAHELTVALGAPEARLTRALFVAGAREPKLADFARMTTLHEIDVLARSGWLLDQLAEGRFTSFFHPIVETRDPTRIFAHEALLRGVERDGSLVAPEPILHLAREAGLLSEVDSAACRTAIREAARHGPGLCVFINFSPAAFEDPEQNLRDTVAAIDEAGLPHDHVVFEVVEADRFDDLPRLERVLRAYRAAGFRVALDDLGAGWSTLNLVHQLRPDFIKLDREMVRDVHVDPVKQLIASKLIEIGRGLHIATIVEGVEREEELAWVRGQGADFVQGYLFGRPRHEPRQSGAAA